jgi:uncharacterized protein YndB with AHSA1/START domain
MTAKKKNKITFEYQIRSSPKILFQFLSTASGLEEWFADKVTVNENVYGFHWDGEDRKAKIAHKRENQLIKFKWLEETDDAFVEFEIITDELTNDVALLVTDFCYDNEKKETQQLWNTQVHNLMHIVGS